MPVPEKVIFGNPVPPKLTEGCVDVPVDTGANLKVIVQVESGAKVEVPKAQVELPVITVKTPPPRLVLMAPDELMVAFAVPLLEKLTVMSLVCPTLTLPKFTLLVFASAETIGPGVALKIAD